MMFKGNASKLTFDPKEGDEVLLEARVSVYERRGNFKNLTFIAMTDLQSPYNLLPDHWENIASISNVVPNTFEVCMNTFDSF